jgi:hypothetical protein
MRNKPTVSEQIIIDKLIVAERERDEAVALLRQADSYMREYIRTDLLDDRAHADGCLCAFDDRFNAFLSRLDAPTDCQHQRMDSYGICIDCDARVNETRDAKGGKA